MKRFAYFVLLALTFALAADAGMVGGGVQGGGPSVTAIPVPVNKGGTGSTTAAGARTNLGAVGLTDTQTLSNKTLTGVSDQLSIVDGTDAQFLHLLRTFTDASNYERLSLGYNGNDAYVRTEFAGTGSARALSLGVQGVNVWTILTSGHLTAATDASYDIGQSGANRPRNLFLSGGITSGGNSAFGDTVGDSHAFLGPLNITDDAGGLIVARSSGGDLAFLAGNAAGSGGTFAVLNAAFADYEPLAINAETITFGIRSGVGTVTTEASLNSSGLTVTDTVNATTYQVSGVAQTFPKTFTATYDPASLAAQNARCDNVTVTGITTTGGAVTANIGATDPATWCVMTSVRASATNTVRICWMNANGVATACDTASSTWTFTQAQ